MKLSDYLKLQGTSQADFAKEIGETPQNVNRYVKGRIPGERQMKKIVSATGGLVTANDFYGIVVTTVMSGKQVNT
jgi:hypothetical protein